jgi:hypothetical protein
MQHLPFPRSAPDMHGIPSSAILDFLEAPGDPGAFLRQTRV